MRTRSALLPGVSSGWLRWVLSMGSPAGGTRPAPWVGCSGPGGHGGGHGARPGSILEQFLLLDGQCVIDVGFGGLGQLVELGLGPAELILAEITLLLEGLELLAARATQVAD